METKRKKKRAKSTALRPSGNERVITALDYLKNSAMLGMAVVEIIKFIKALLL